ncbi:VOC family protein [Methylobacterium planeticum]|uniref:VOC family protein n=1 Tax=Methylobacterium planeticum TaxID=2615211 RepID=A0A6N6MJ04_9HYPH|nr:VOC family protein [Methylobacterium planeticum]KAB1070423.1 VOC family protein [Methylobacterium planeticum]
MSGIRSLHAISRTVADLARTEAFYRDGLGFVREAPPEPLPAPPLQAMGLGEAGGWRLRMRIGEQVVAFLNFDPPGAAYPAAPAATDPFFQHIAIPVRDMERAMRALSTLHPVPISQGGAQILPETSGGVSAFKFRDPDGHPVELIHFPGGDPAARWRDAPGLFLGIDHSAITVTDLDAALAFYTGTLGLTLGSRGLNRGPEQARLDGVPDPEVDVIGLAPPLPTPHVELLHYRRPASGAPERPASGAPEPPPFGPRDRATTRFVFAVDDVPALAQRIRAAGYPAEAAPDGSVAYGSGPDGHGFLLVGPTAPGRA